MSSTPPGLASRLVAWQVLQSVAAGAYADGALERELGRMQLSSSDRALATELAYGSIRQRRLLDAWLNQLGRVPVERQPPKLRWLLHLGLYQLLLIDRVPESAAVSTTVELAKHGGLTRLAPVVNGVLRSFLRRRALQETLALPSDPVEAFAIRHSLPDWLAKSLLQWRSHDDALAFARAINHPPAIDLRINPLRSTPEQLQADFQQAGVQLDRIEGLPCGLTVVGRSGDLRRLPGYAEGHWCVQDRSAQRVALLLQPLPGETILDACAAPGGKSTHLAELMGDEGMILALDRGESRLKRVLRNAERLGLHSIVTRHGDALSLHESAPDLIGRFDALLLDAPCSGLGTLSRHADARWRIDPESIAELVSLQRELLEKLLHFLKPGGRLVYATCTVNPDENQQLIADFLSDHPELSLTTSWQLWPGDWDCAGDGFYAALLRLD